MGSEAEIRRLALGCMLLGFVGPTPPPWLLDGLAKGLGGVVLFASNLSAPLGDGSSSRASAGSSYDGGSAVGPAAPDSADTDEFTCSLTAGLREAAGREIVIALDEEGGDVTRLDQRRGSRLPGAAALGWLDETSTTAAVYAAVGKRLATAGVTLNLAPVADVNTDPRNPVIGVRSFGADPILVARHVAAAVSGTQRSGVAACAKHFPGHGATRADSHHEVATIDRSTSELDAVELAPFEAAIAAGVRAVMTGHLMVPALDASSIATVSHSITTGLLRNRLGFSGTVVTDALEMKAISTTMGLPEGLVQAIIAGADAVETGALNYPGMISAGADAVARAVAEGRLTMARLEEAAARTRLLSAGGKDSVPYDQELVALAAARCIEVVGALPVLRRPVLIECDTPNGMATGDMPWSLALRVAAQLDESDVIMADETTTVDIPFSRPVLLVVRDPDRFPFQRKLIEALTGRPGLVIADLGWPAELPDGVPYVRTRGVSPGLLDAAAAVLSGRVAPVVSTGRIL